MEAYLPCPDLWVITTYFNPVGYQALRRNYARFAAPIVQAGLNLVTVECAFGEGMFELTPSPQVIQVRTNDMLWLKERLINLAILRLPPHAQKIVWVDADILFTNPAWAQQTATLLDRWPIVQPFDCVERLKPRQNASDGGAARRSFACQLQRRPESAHLGGAAHGQPGIAWAARRDLVERHGVYDADILGGNDELFAHAAAGALNSHCIRFLTCVRLRRRPGFVDKMLNRLLRIPWPSWLAQWYLARTQPASPAPGEQFLSHYLRWAQPFAAEVRGQIGCTPGRALHLWHGHPINRQYASRTMITRRHVFDPERDIGLNSQGVWQWNSDKPQLHQEVRDYFFARCDDD